MIEGITYVHDFFNPASEEVLVAFIDQQDWDTGLRRRVQHYGFRYDYKSRSVDESHSTRPLPSLFADLGQQIANAAGLDKGFSQVIVNEYQPGQGIASHIDSFAFGDCIASLSLLSACIMRFDQLQTGEKCELVLLPRSLLIMRGEARRDWKHGIAARKSDVIDGAKQLRQRRISLTFRQL